MLNALRPLVGLLAIAAISLHASTADAGGRFRGGAVGGVFIDADGVVSSPEKGDNAQLIAVWQADLQPVPQDLQQYTERRFVSLRGLEEQVAKAATAGEPLDDALRYLAGLLRVEYVLVYPERNDIVLAGPAEGWKVDALGNTVGITTNRPVLMLEDLIVALRTAEGANGKGISCSIDPTPEGLERVQQVIRNTRPGTGPALAARRLEQALGRQVITVSGVPDTSHFARTMVAADFRMKRLAMDFEPAPVDGLPSYLDLIPKRGRVDQNMLPRWWLAASYDPVQTDEAEQVFHIRGQGVKCMTEEDFVSQSGERTRTGKSSTTAQKWADLMTERFGELAGHDSAFGHLRNAMDLSVAAAVIAQNRLMERAKLEAPQLTDNFQIEAYNAPRTVASRASLVRKANSWVITASGGVQFYPWEVADKLERSEEVASTHADGLAAAKDAWWWQ